MILFARFAYSTLVRDTGVVALAATLLMLAFSFEPPMALDAGATVGDTYDTTVTTYDSLGNSVELTFNFTNTAANTWSWYVTPSTGSALPASGSPYVLAFNTSGDLVPGSCTPPTTGQRDSKRS